MTGASLRLGPGNYGKAKKTRHRSKFVITVCNITNYFSFGTLYELNVLLNVMCIELTTIKYVAP